MDNAEEVAKKLRQTLIQYLGQVSFSDGLQVENMIAAALRDYCKHDLCKDCGCTYENCCCNPVREMKARNDALEEAAKIAAIANSHISDEIRRLRVGDE